MGQYYFAVGSLPMLFYGGNTGPDRETFLRICEENCTKKDYILLSQASLTPREEKRTRSTVINGWNAWETALRNELVLLRGKGKGKDSGKEVRESDAFYTDVADLAREAYSQDSPFQAEELLNHARWQRLEELEAGHHFDMEKLLVYYLKLQLNERKASFSKETGKEQFSRIYSDVRNQDKRGDKTAGENT
ncbi:MAG: DUF2764 family protein [Spirochaetales bacterium]|nr:DUF2764 family protein [Spirochaetales bacterium]